MTDKPKTDAHVANNRSTQAALLSVLAEVNKELLRYLDESADSTLPPVGDGQEMRGSSALIWVVWERSGAAGDPSSIVGIYTKETVARAHCARLNDGLKYKCAWIVKSQLNVPIELCEQD